ncbi:MAG: iron donor protein CyaY [Burkholderiales bacterium PBB4]|nr:MAG: iron donor protein CyaY [Burkholderiales bacterium PBB4]
MTELEFMSRAEVALQAIEACCDQMNARLDVDVDNQRSGNMLTLTFANGTQIIVNLQKPLHEIWLAAKTGGYHYRWVDNLWLDTKGQGELFATLSLNASLQAGQTLEFKV